MQKTYGSAGRVGAEQQLWETEQQVEMLQQVCALYCGRIVPSHPKEP